MLAEAPPRLTYLTAPYRHPSRTVRDARVEAVGSIAAGLTDNDRSVFCPLTYAQPLLEHGFGDRDDQWWYDYDVGWLPYCDELVVLMLPGREESEGVWIEIETAGTLGIRICYLEVPERFIGLTLAQCVELHLGLSG